MGKIRINKAFFLFVVTAFLTMQWATAHIHLAEHHDHDGSHHQHDVQAHAHQSISHHGDVIDVFHQSSDDNIVELDQESSVPCWKTLGDKVFVAVLVYAPLLPIPQYSHIKLSKADNPQQSYLSYATHRPRAPPAYS